jgi:hypothetical protein
MIQDLKDLQKLFKLCRAQGVIDIKVNGLEIKFGDLPTVQGALQSASEEEVILNPYDGFPQDILSNDQLSHYAQGGTVENDPFLKKAN